MRPLTSGVERVDLVVLSRDTAPLRERVQAGIDAQRDVSLCIHRIVGAPRPEDPTRWATIARARNEGKWLGQAGWLMFLDDDVVLEPGCVGRLVAGLRRRPGYAALASDYLGEIAATFASPETPPHVAMGATLFRRDRLAPITFRSEPEKCECQCCCDDLRRAGHGIGYLPEAGSSHEPQSSPVSHHGRATAPGAPPRGEGRRLPGRVLAAFDRNHVRRFQGQFLQSLRRAGNQETVTAACYGLNPSELSRLSRLPGVEVVPQRHDGDSPSLHRLRDFPDLLARWPEDTPVAYWDAGDVLFQARLEPLWDMVRANPDRLFAVREPLIDPERSAIWDWTRTIDDLQARQSAYELLLRNPYLNGGFAAGTAGTMIRYGREAHRLRHSSAMRGTLDWGDQTALNLYCHSAPGRWIEADAGWNFCLLARPRSEYRVEPGRGILTPEGAPIPVIHGNAGTLRWFELSFLA